MVFFRRMYYDRTTGEAVHIRMAKGDVHPPDPSEDFLRQPELNGRSLADTALLEWRREEESTELLFRTKLPSVDVSGEQPRLVWNDFPPNAEYDETADMRAALEYLGVDESDAETEE